MNYNPLVSIALLSFNRLADLKETLTKIKDIKYNNLEILVVDNNSDDGSIEFIKSYDKIKLKYFFSKENSWCGIW